MSACGVFDAFDGLVYPCGVGLDSGELLLVVSDGLDHGHDVADTTVMLSVMPRDLATSLMSLSFSSSWIGFLGDLGQRNLSIAD